LTAIALSPDGSRVAYADEHGVYVLGIDSRETKRIAVFSIPKRDRWRAIYSARAGKHSQTARRNHSKIAYSGWWSRALYEASILSNHKRTGNFLSLERAQRKEVFVSQLLALERLGRLRVMAKSEGEGTNRPFG